MLLEYKSYGARTLNYYPQYQLHCLLTSQEETMTGIGTFEINESLYDLSELTIRQFNKIEYVTTKPEFQREFLLNYQVQDLNNDKLYLFLETLYESGAITTAVYDFTRKQLDNFIFLEGLAFPMQEIQEYARSMQQPPVIYNKHQSSSPTSTKPTSLIRSEEQQEIYISSKAIRAITGYEPVPWQERLLKDTNRWVFVVGSRQIGKSFTVGEMAIEHSFLPNQTILVTSFVEKSTKAIWDYIVDMVSKFEKTDFEIKIGDKIIINSHSGSKIKFFTLSEDGKKVRGQKANLIIVDEAAFVANGIFERVLMPATSTVNGRIVCISSPDTKNWFFEKVMEAKRGEPNTSFYEITIDDNPFVDDVMREYVRARRHKPEIQQEYYCKFAGNLLGLPVPPAPEEIPTIKPSSYLVFGYDPARKGRDRAGINLDLVQDGKITTLASTFIPEEYKAEWNKQHDFIKKFLSSFDQTQIVKVIDCTGVGDGVVKIFETLGFRFDIAINYTTGTNIPTEPEQESPYMYAEYYKVPKGVMVNKYLDFVDEGFAFMVPYTNKYLEEEINMIEKKKNSLGLPIIETKFYDDIFNSNMICKFAVYARGLLGKKRNILEMHSENTVICENEYRNSNGVLYSELRAYKKPRSNKW